MDMDPASQPPEPQAAPEAVKLAVEAAAKGYTVKFAESLMASHQGDAPPTFEPAALEEWFAGAILEGVRMGQEESAEDNAIQFTMRALGHLVGEKVTRRELQSFVDKIGAGNLAESGKLREIIREGGERYQKLLKAMHCKLLAYIFGTWSQAMNADSEGIYLEVHGRIPKYQPGLTVPDTIFGAWILDEVMDWWSITGLLPVSERKIMRHKPAPLPPPELPKQGKPGKHVNGKSHNPPAALFSEGGIIIERSCND